MTHYSACPHDCPSTCALEVEKIDDNTIGKVRGASENTYTAGVICSKVARYRERIHHPDRLTQPLRRTGSKGSAEFAPISWDDALDEVAEHFLAAEQRYGSETVWPYYYAGTMGLVMRDGINRLRHVKRYSGFYSTICVTPAWNGFIAGTGRLAGVDPREMGCSDLVIIWGTNAASTQINVMTHALKARRERGAKIVVIDTYKNATAKQADLFLCVRPGTDGALACALMHVLFRDGKADRDYLQEFTDCPEALETHLASRDPAWAEGISGVPAGQIETLASMIGNTPRTFFRLGYGFTRQRNGAANMHAALSIAAVAGSWRHEGGGAFHNNGGIYHWDKTLIEGSDCRDPKVRVLDQSRIGPILTGDRRDLGDGPPVSALLIQNTNPMSVAPDLNRVHEGFAREDLFVCVHEQFMTETAQMADIVLPATMFLEHDDLYQAGGHQHITLGPRIVNPPEGCRSNHEVICALAKRLGANHAGFDMSPRELIDRTLQDSGWGNLDDLEEKRWIDCQPGFRDSHYLDGFAHADGRFHFSPDWNALLPHGFGPAGAVMPNLPDHWDVIEKANSEMPYRLVTAPARHYLNSTFTETPTSNRRQKRPSAMLHPDDARDLKVSDGDTVRLGNLRGEIPITAEVIETAQRGVVIVESIWPNRAFTGSKGINVLTGADPVAPVGGAAVHDTRIWIRPEH
ncbi:MAG: dehydrogenase [Acidiferrobacteraceae bacterium]|jgi:anaerobic selenocysteine-containing dehydrogenase|nr:dehydrogenase [Acidiferrobacteraceae bacterium]MDP6398190.1 molybdopterin-dependent oxidoreductase [Arenicellales bacterium]MDP6552805.1 molybdopterin-dependent oxidoreductase [Arenicellales bacterium]MDP6792118.1 molybdopterin-dependent oxidoreductase [Arenicellales bacterium]MDP6919919.1 molybdopterin-dependent oxidoreductase [Arenicellales bacterium]|tara:strand:- start:3514 stop:5577 length:2064 start_codon:yes stop_codon:yes gene_type:complete